MKNKVYTITGYESREEYLLHISSTLEKAREWVELEKQNYSYIEVNEVVVDRGISCEKLVAHYAKGKEIGEDGFEER